MGWEDPLEEGMATHSSILAWRVPGTEEPGGLQSIGSQRIGRHWRDWARMRSLFAIDGMVVFLPGSYIETLTPHEMVLGYGAFGIWLI